MRDPVGDVDAATLTETRRVLQSIVLALEEDVRDREVRMSRLDSKRSEQNSGDSHLANRFNSMIDSIPEDRGRDPSFMDTEVALRGSGRPNEPGTSPQHASPEAAGKLPSDI